jgi:hypothetical protein
LVDSFKPLTIANYIIDEPAKRFLLNQLNAIAQFYLRASNLTIVIVGLVYETVQIFEITFRSNGRIKRSLKVIYGTCKQKNVPPYHKYFGQSEDIFALSLLGATAPAGYSFYWLSL